MSEQEPSLDVYLAHRHCGHLSEDSHGALSFAYDAGYEGIPLSLSMPVGLATYGDRVVRPYLMGLLPDDQSTRAAIGAPYGITGDNPFRLLALMGADCPGAVQVMRLGREPSGAGEAGQSLVLLHESDIESRLAAVRENATAAWTGADLSQGHWSLGGCQAKVALRFQEGRWYECVGDAATTHILKPGVAGFRYQALCEYLSMRVARAVGLPAAKVSYRRFGDEPAIVVERFDRVRLDGGAVARIHQEDFCQSLSVMPTSKYADQGGPTTPRIVSLLRGTGANARENVYRFVLYLFFNYLIGATDAHAKNHSILFAGVGDIRLAPLYDVASIAPYRSLMPTQRKPLRSALSIGGENRFGLVGAKHIESMVRVCGLDDLGLGAGLLCDRLRVMAELLPDAVARETEAAIGSGIEGAEGLAAPFESEVRANCRRTLALL